MNYEAIVDSRPMHAVRTCFATVYAELFFEGGGASPQPNEQTIE